MKKKKWFISGFATVTLGLLVYTSPGVGAAYTPQENIKLSNTTSILSLNSELIGHVSTTKTMTVTIGLKLRNEPGLKAYIASLNDPTSPNYKHYLSPDQFKNLYEPTDSTVSSVKDFFINKGLEVKNVSSANDFITVTGSTGQIENALNVTLNNYKKANGQVYFANEQAPSIPAQLSGAINSIIGLNNELHYSHPNIIKSKPSIGSGPGGGYDPAEIQSAYDIIPLENKGYNGSGQTVALMELDGYVQSNISYFDQYYNLNSPSPTNVLVDGYDGSANDGENEVELDIETINVIAPKANVLVYEGPNNEQGSIDTYQEIASDDLAKSVSISWGISEDSESIDDINSLDTIFQQMAVQGQSVFVASGDNGAYDQNGNLSVDSPADDPYATGVGGTSLNLDGNSYGSESAWSDPTDGSGSGGGISTVFSMPSYQTGTGVLNQYSDGYREVPDVSADADPNTGFSIYSQGSWSQYGGTSAAAPLWAALAAINNQYATANGNGVLGQANLTLYKMFNTTQPYQAYHDITSGNNLYYPATTGYDLATGIGTPDAYNLIRDINLSTATINYSTAKPTNQNVVATLVTSKPITVTNNGGSNQYTFTDNGTFTFEYVDAVGNKGMATATVANIYKTPPVTTDNAPKNWVNKDVTVKLMVTDNGGPGVANTYYQLDNGPIQSGNAITISAEGGHTLTYWSVDHAGNVEQRHEITVKIDKTAPTTSLSTNPGSPNGKNGWYISDVQVSLRARDSGGSGVANTEYKINGGAWIAYTGSFNLTKDGTYTINYRSTDMAGNVESYHTKTIKLDKTTPMLKISLNKIKLSPPNNQMIPIMARIKASDSAAGINSVVLTSITCNEKLNSNDIQNAKYNVPISGSTDSFKLRAKKIINGKECIYIITFKATDKAGNSTTQTVTVTVPR